MADTHYLVWMAGGWTVYGVWGMVNGGCAPVGDSRGQLSCID